MDLVWGGCSRRKGVGWEDALEPKPVLGNLGVTWGVPSTPELTNSSATPQLCVREELGSLLSAFRSSAPFFRKLFENKERGNRDRGGDWPGTSSPSPGPVFSPSHSN